MTFGVKVFCFTTVGKCFSQSADFCLTNNIILFIILLSTEGAGVYGTVNFSHWREVIGGVCVGGC